ncbi:phosphatase PAP2 family protein [Muricoccus aerilatus]|uniref:phosphatase PAP2 family protein n=1 Tax=Muricoccus aerilatus TaxID=452982 RepID=UPI000A577055|nr:phosphatase PAP2 family protein [Roseomonas aerilata]
MLPLTRARAATTAAWLIGAMLYIPSALAQPPAGDAAEPGAGRWRTWVLSSSSQFRLPPPPDAAATRDELGELQKLAMGRDPETRRRIAWWAAVAPSYRWNQVALEASLRAGLSANLASRRLALLHTALADGMVAAWDSKYVHARPRPAATDPTLSTVGATPSSPSYPDEHAVAGAIAATILSELFPQRAAEFARLAAESGRMRLLAGVAFPSDVAAGATLGAQVAAAALERGRKDRSDQPWTGSVPAGPGLWSGTNPVFPQAATWRPWLLETPDEFRPPPPAAHDSPERAAEMEFLRGFPRAPATSARALFWEAAVGGLRNHEYWNNHAGRLLLESGQAASAPRAARAYALLNVAFYDAGVACWDAKYTYWTIRPFQLDPRFQPVFATPNHPSYPAAHACYSTTSALVLAHLFPEDAAALMALARESGESRIWAGIHYPSDVAAGQQLAERVAARAIERAREDGAEAGPP